MGTCMSETCQCSTFEAWCNVIHAHWRIAEGYPHGTRSKAAHMRSSGRGVLAKAERFNRFHLPYSSLIFATNPWVPFYMESPSGRIFLVLFLLVLLAAERVSRTHGQITARPGLLLWGMWSRKPKYQLNTPTLEAWPAPIPFFGREMPGDPKESSSRSEKLESREAMLSQLNTQPDFPVVHLWHLRSVSVSSAMKC